MKFETNKLNQISLGASVLGIIAFIFDYGFKHVTLEQQIIDGFYFFVIALGLISTGARYLANPNLINRRKVFIFDAVSIAFTLYVFYMYLFVGKAFETDLVLENPVWVILAVILSFIREFSEIRLHFNRTFINPAQLFVLSFFGIIMLGTGLLLLPEATVGELSFLDAVFTATSAVCVTGLIVVDTSTFFTSFGHSIILFLIQIGGLGILTFASYFNYFFKGNTSYESQLSLSEITQTKSIGNVFKTLKTIILVTLVVEFVSAIGIYFTLPENLMSSFEDKAFFSVFHAISAFCNAGFSTLSESIYDGSFKFNYALQYILAFTFIFGGLGFNIVSNVVFYFKHLINKRLLNEGDEIIYKPWLLTINSRITLITTAILILVGFIGFFIFEYHNTLAEHPLYGKIAVAFFGGTTPRTAGFNSVDMGALAFPTVMLTFLLMWIGASPASTGGGIKTSTFAVATLNIWSLAQGKTKIEVFRREIADISVRRAFATIALSLIALGLGIIIISIYDSEKSLLAIAFECFSAYSTVGLSLGITSSLSPVAKVVIIVIMFVGRVSFLSILLAFVGKVKAHNYRYPSEEITIN